MAVTPSELFELAVTRHRQPWNLSLHCAGAGLFALALLAHSYLLLAAALILLGAGFLALEQGVPPDNGWFRRMAAVAEWEKDWASLPWNWRKIWRFGLAVLLCLIAVWALWTGEPAAIGLLIGGAALAWVIRDNREKDAWP